jgi:hypothetical protein
MAFSRRTETGRPKAPLLKAIQLQIEVRPYDCPGLLIRRDCARLFFPKKQGAREMAQIDAEHLMARGIVLEMLLATTIIELARHGTGDVESFRRIMDPVEQQLLAMTREAARGKEAVAKEAKLFFDSFSETILANVPHQGKH